MSVAREPQIGQIRERSAGHVRPGSGAPGRSMRVPATLIAYAAPAIPLAFLGLPLYVYLPAHYAGLPGIGLAMVGVVLLGARLLDLFTDPLVGLLSDRLRARLRPQWIISVGALMMLAGAWWLFRPPAGAGALYLFATLALTYLGWTLLAIPYYALGAELAVDDDAAAGDASQQHADAGHAHTRVAAWREAGVVVGTVLALVVPALFSGQAPLEASAQALLWLTPPSILAVWWLRSGHRSSTAQARAPATAGLLAMWRDTSCAARQLLGIHLLNALAGGTAATLFIIYTRDVIGVDDATGGLLLLVYFAAGLLALPLWVALSRRIGQARSWQLAMLLAALGFLPAAFIGDGQLVAFGVVCVLTGATLGADIAMPAAIQSRIVAAESRQLERPRGGALFGLWGMAGKLALALSAGLSLPLLALFTLPQTGLDRAAVTPWLYAGLPVMIKLLAVVLLRRSVLMRAQTAQGSPLYEEVSDVA